jgi:hypothetical protein
MSVEDLLAGKTEVKNQGLREPTLAVIFPDPQPRSTCIIKVIAEDLKHTALCSCCLVLGHADL